MHIIGIQIEKGCDTKVIKNLRPGWYPFGDYDKPGRQNDFKWRNGSAQSDRLYQLYPDMPQISVSCIIGMNGSGKTTLLDVLFRIINNFSAIVCKETKEYGTPIDTYEVEYAEGLNAKLFFEVEGNIGYIHSTYKMDDNEKPLEFVKTVDEEFARNSSGHFRDFQSILENLFYTIGINYSIHSMRFKDRSGLDEGYNQWMCNIYYNDQNYLVPLSFAPYRNNGVIDINRDDTLAYRRLTTLSILLYSQGKQLIKGYNPQKIKYVIKETDRGNDIPKELVTLEMNKQALRNGIYYNCERIIKQFTRVWEASVLDLGCYDKDMKDIILESLACETTRICLTYPNYGKIFNLKSIFIHEDGQKYKEALNDAHFDDVVQKIFNSIGNDPIVADIDQILTFISIKKIIDKSGEILVSDLISNDKGENIIFNAYDELYRLIPPTFYDIELFSTRNGEDDKEINLSEMSSAERQLLYSNSAVLYHIYNLANTQQDTRIIPYKHINIVLDEVELYYHPEYQRTYIASFIDMLAGLHINKERIKSINLIIATHSPFILSDVPKENVLCLQNGKSQFLGKESYCANIYDLLNDSFFLDYPMGEVAKRILDEVIEDYNQHRRGIKYTSHIREKRSFYKYLINIISDPYIRETMSSMLSSILDEKLYDKYQLIERQEILRKELNEITNQLSEIDE